MKDKAMKIVVLGGGPAGLYASLLLKKANPALDITIIERNPAGATYGWGVVFSDHTLNSFREADIKTYTDITNQFVIWEAIDIWYRGELVRCGGHTFAGLSRRKLLLILQERCKELGIDLRFEQDITDLSGLPKYDLLIAADGVNSLVRATYADAFKPSLEVNKAKFVWFGTTKVFDSFTFIFRENEHGLFQVHAYPFDGVTSTFIVECAEEVWQRAGLDKASEQESLAYCQKLFAADLCGSKLMSNRSLWVNFLTVRCKTWRHNNIVLMGDSAHTAHFSIGSGTKLAMEDSIAFANAFEKHENDLLAALKDYEAERRPRVEMLQAAAHESRTYFENVSHYLHLEPMQFAFYLLTRSGRISYDSLRLRDPSFSDAVDRWFTDTTSPEEQRGAIIAPPPMFTPFQLRQMQLSNRVVLAPTASYSAQEGLPNETHLNQLLCRAKGGAALVLTEPVAVSAQGRITSGCAGLYTAQQQAAWANIVKAVHSQSKAKIALQLNHAGRRGSTRPRQQGLDRPLLTGNWPLLSASALPYTPRSQTPAAMSRAEMDKVKDDFIQATHMAHEADFDMLQLHLAHGYLLASFISPLTNIRTDDEYGGPLENRLRYPLEVFEAVRAVWPESKPLAAAIPASDWVNGGFEMDEALILAQMLKERGCDILEPLAGQSVPHPKPVYDPPFLLLYSDQIRNLVNISTLASGGITTTDQINSILGAGRADLCVLSPKQLLE
jgi:anthraniloyl-CoA monooxygenase